MASSKRTLNSAKLGIGASALCLLIGCSADPLEPWTGAGETVATDTEAATGWTNLTLNSGWSNYNTTGNTPQVKLTSNNTVIFRGAIKATAGTTNDSPFTLPSAFNTVNPDAIDLRVVMAKSGSTLYGGTLYIDQDHVAHVFEDGTSSLGSHAKTMTSLEGVSYDTSAEDAQEVFNLNGTQGLYPYRNQGTERGASGKLVGGFVRLQGLLIGADNPNAAAQLPSALIPGQNVWTPISLCPGTGGTHADILITSGGTIWVEPEGAGDESCFASLEGVSYALSPGGSTLSLGTGWSAFSPRPVKARNDGGVIRLQGAVFGGTTATTLVATLPSTMRPPATVYVATVANDHTRARLAIDTSGNVVVDAPGINTARQFLSLDGVFFSQ